MPEDKPVEIKFDTARFEQALGRMPNRLFVGLSVAFRRVGDNFIKTLTKERLSGAGEHSLARRTGTLARSFVKAVAGDSTGSLQLMIFTNCKYAPIHEYGGRILPKRSKYLAIPLQAARYARTGAGRYQSPRDIPDLVYGGRSAAGNIILRKKETGYIAADKTIRKGVETRGRRVVGGTPMFVLVKSVTIKPRLGMVKTWRRDMPGYIQLLNESVTKVLGE